MTTKQRQQVEWLKRAILWNDGLREYQSEHQYKRFDVEESGGNVYVTTEVGRIGDEGTFAEVWARTNRIVRIGTRGGMQLVNTAKRVGGKTRPARTLARGRSVAYARTW